MKIRKKKPEVHVFAIWSKTQSEAQAELIYATNVNDALTEFLKMHPEFNFGMKDLGVYKESDDKS